MMLRFELPFLTSLQQRTKCVRMLSGSKVRHGNCAKANSNRNRNPDIRSSSPVFISNKILGSQNNVIYHKTNVDVKGIHNKLAVAEKVEKFMIVFT